MILMNDFKREPSDLRDAQIAALTNVVDSGWYILGEQLKAFELKWSSYVGAKYCAGVANGLDAIEIGLRALNLAPGDEVVTSSLSAFATVLAILRAGLTPVLADIDPTNGLIDIESATRCISPRTKAVLVVHLYGQACNMDAWKAFCQTHRLSLLEDCAQAHGAKWGGRAVGTHGLFGAWSFYPTKNLGALGDAGALTTNDENLFNKTTMIRNYGQSERYYHPMLGMNSRTDELQAALLSVRLSWLDQFTEQRRAVAAHYWSAINNSKITMLQPPKDPSSHTHHLFVIRTKRRGDLIDHLRNRDICSLIHYPVPMHHQQPCKSIARDPNGLPRVETFAQECLSLPCHPQMTADEVGHVIEAVNAF